MRCSAAFALAVRHLTVFSLCLILFLLRGFAVALCHPVNAYDLVKDGSAFCLAKLGQAYALYLPTGGSVTVSLAPDVRYEVAWWNPANGKDGRFQDKETVAGGPQRLTAPSDGDWAVRIIRRAAS